MTSECTLEVICEGLPWNMGIAQGRALREKILGACRVLPEVEAFRLMQPAWWPFPIFRRVAARRARRALRIGLSHSFAAANERLEGIAVGAGVRVEDIYLLNAMEPLLSDVRELTVNVPIGACSAVAVRGSRSASGEPIIARNFDYLPLVQPFYTLRDSRPALGFRSLDFTAAPLCGTVDGLNEHGLCITYDYAHATDAARPSAPITMIVTDALEQCRTVSQAAERIASKRRWGAGLLMLADADGDIASLQLSNTRSHLVRPAAGEDLLFHSNAFAGCDMADVEVSHDAVYTGAAPQPLCGRRVLESSEERDCRFAELTARKRCFSPDDLAALMADHGPAGEPSPNSICMHSGYWNTTACLQLFPRSRRLRVAFDSACRAKYTEFCLDFIDV